MKYILQYAWAAALAALLTSAGLHASSPKFWLWALIIIGCLKLRDFVKEHA
jgi:hypothetical protein